MALKSLFEKFKKKFDWEGKNLKELTTNIFAKGQKSVEDKLLQDTFSDWKKQEKKLGKLELPNPADFFTSNVNLVRLGNIKGEKITDTLKENLLGDLKKAIDNNRTTGLFKKGNLLNDNVLNSFKENLKGTFDTYIKEDKLTGSKLESIALTESRGIVNKLKYEYMIKVNDNNPKIRIEKIWQHYPWKSKEPRKGHSEKNKQSIRIDRLYRVNYYKKEKGKLRKRGVDLMRYPHDQNVGARQNVNCHCDIRFDVKRK